MSRIISFSDHIKLSKRMGKSLQKLRPSITEYLLQAADSYRGFKVFAIAVGTDKNGVLTYLRAANSKPTKYCLKDCAECKILREARERGISLIGMMVVGPPQPDQESGIETLTLHSCGKCRHTMWWYIQEGSGVITPQTLFLLARPDFSLIEMYAIEELWEIHGDLQLPPEAERLGKPITL